MANADHTNVLIYSNDDECFPAAPCARVRVASTPDGNEQAPTAAFVAAVSRDWEMLPDAKMVALMTEP